MGRALIVWSGPSFWFFWHLPPTLPRCLWWLKALLLGAYAIKAELWTCGSHFSVLWICTGSYTHLFDYCVWLICTPNFMLVSWALAFHPSLLPLIQQACTRFAFQCCFKGIINTFSAVADEYVISLPLCLDSTQKLLKRNWLSAKFWVAT